MKAGLTALAATLAATGALAAVPPGWEQMPSNGGVERSADLAEHTTCRLIGPSEPQFAAADKSARAFLSDLAAGRFEQAYASMTKPGRDAQPFADFVRRASTLRSAASQRLFKIPLQQPVLNEQDLWEGPGPNATVEGDIGGAAWSICTTGNPDDVPYLINLTTASRQVFFSYRAARTPRNRDEFYIALAWDGGAWRVGGAGSGSIPPVILGDYPVPMRSLPPPTLQPRQEVRK